MNKNDDITLDNIINYISEQDENKNFISNKDRIYRLEAVRWLFTGLKRNRQNEILNLMSGYVREEMLG